MASSGGVSDEGKLDRVVHMYLKKKQYKESAIALEQESSAKDLTLDQMRSIASIGLSAESEVANQLAAAVAHGDDPSMEKLASDYRRLNEWIESSLDQYRNELYTVMYPIFVHCYLDFVIRGKVEAGRAFMASHAVEHQQYHHSELEELKGVTTAEHMASSTFVEIFRKNKYTLVLCSYSFELLLAFLQEHKFMTILGIINQHVAIKVFTGKPQKNYEALGLTGATSKEVEELHKKREIYWGNLKQDEVEKALDEDDGEEEEEVDDAATRDGAPARKRAKRAHLATVANGPKPDNIPLPRLTGQALQMRLDHLKEVRQRVGLGPTTLPSACVYTFFNTDERMYSMSFSDNVERIAGGFADSYIKIWDLTKKGLPALRPAEELKEMDLDGSTSLEDLLSDERPTHRNLFGHGGAVYDTCFSSDNSFLLSASEDGTARLWDLHTYTNVVCYKGHIYPVWAAQFSPVGSYYFATASHDRTARLWSTDFIYPLRIFAGHLSDVHCVKFHPNSNYIATGSSDRSCRLWDVQSGECVRVLEGHSDAVHALAFSEDGRYLATGADDHTVVLWDLRGGKKLSTFKGHTDVVHSVSFSGEGSLVASGGADNTVRIWDAKSGAGTTRLEEAETPFGELAATPESTSDSVLGTELAAYPTKQTPIFTTKFTAKNVLMCAGMLGI